MICRKKGGEKALYSPISLLKKKRREKEGNGVQREGSSEQKGTLARSRETHPIQWKWVKRKKEQSLRDLGRGKIK